MPARVTLGTGVLSGRTTPATARRLLDAAFDAGVRSIDTARAYGDGETEWFLGRVLANRPDVEIVTKVGLGPLERRPVSGIRWRAGSRVLSLLPGGSGGGGEDGAAPVARLDAASVRASVDLSRRALRRDRLDLLLLHEVDAATGGERVADLLDGLVAAEAIGAWGVGTRRAAVAGLVAAGVPVGSRVQTAGGPLAAPVDELPSGAALSVHSVLGSGGSLLGAFLAWLPRSAHRAAWERLVGPVDARRTAGDAVLRVAGATPGVAAVLVSSHDPATLARSIAAVGSGESPERMQALAGVFGAFRDARASSA